MVRLAMEIVALGSFLAVVYSYAVYPFVLLCIAALNQLASDIRFMIRKQDRRSQQLATLPAIAIIISAYNEETHIRARIENLLALDYPLDRVSIYIGSDGSRDQTGRILSEYSGHPNVRPFVFDVNRGKANVLNDLVSRTTEPILVFSDANTFFERQAIRYLLAPFAQPEVGGVSGELRLESATGDNQDSLYWRVEQVLKFLEGRIGGLLGANGAIYAIRREHWRTLSSDTICDDFCVAMSVAATGARLVYAPNAIATEDTPAQIGDEYRRRVRIGIGNFQALLRHPEYLTATSTGTRFAYVSHKVLRWIAPHLLIVSMTCSAMLAADWQWLAFNLAQIIGYSAAALLYLMSLRGKKMSGILRIVAFLFALNWAFLVASVRFSRGRYSGAWGRTKRA